MELQDRSRLYPTLSQPQGALVMGSDGRLQYAQLSGAPVGLAPSAPPAPVSSAPQQHYQQLPIASIPPASSDALQAQRSLDCWAKWVRIVSIILFALTATFAIIWATELIYPSHYGQKKHCPFRIAMKLVVFVLLLVTFKFGAKAGTLKTSAAAKRFLKMLIFMGVFGLVLGGFKAYWRMKRRHEHRKYHDKDMPEDVERSEEGESNEPEERIPPPTRLLQDADDADDNDDADDADDNDDNDDADDSDDADDNDDTKNSKSGCGHDGHNGHKGHNSDWKDDDRDDRDDGDDSDDRDDRDDSERSEHRGFKGRKHCHVGCLILLAIYALVVFMAYKLYRAARNFEQHAQRGNIPVVPVMVQQPVQAYAPGLYPGNIPVGAPVQH